MLAKLTSEMLAAVGAANAAEFPEKFSAFVTKANQDAQSMATAQVTLETLQASITALEGKLLTEDRIKAICGESATAAISTWAASETGKKIIGAEASRITAEALASVGTAPAKPAPLSDAGNDSPEAKAKDLIAQGKFEEAFPLIPASERADFTSAKNYAFYMRNRRSTKITSKK